MFGFFAPYPQQVGESNALTPRNPREPEVDAANLELVLDPAKQEEHGFIGGQLAVIDPEKCTTCGI
ncbi:MAG: hypothetical protein SXV54_11560 [Chloroflexota bacterium]|nr:hypothetical protein [Chloroflexota bacterium]